jgi:xanthine/uracil/vitamin C permease (AzgA family)
MQTETRTWVRRARPWLLALEIVAWTGFFAFALTFLALRYWVLPEIDYRSCPAIPRAIAGGKSCYRPDWRLRSRS